MSYKNHKDQKLLVEAYKNINFNKSQSINEGLDPLGAVARGALYIPRAVGRGVIKTAGLLKTGYKKAQALRRGISIKALKYSEKLQKEFIKSYLPNTDTGTKKNLAWYQAVPYKNDEDGGMVKPSEEVKKRYASMYGKKTTRVVTNKHIFLFLVNGRLWSRTLLELYQSIQTNPAILNQENEEYKAVFDKVASDIIDNRARGKLRDTQIKPMEMLADTLEKKMAGETPDTTAPASPPPNSEPPDEWL